jgi:hypothetical protein
MAPISNMDSYYSVKTEIKLIYLSTINELLERKVVAPV